MKDVHHSGVELGHQDLDGLVGLAAAHRTLANVSDQQYDRGFTIWENNQEVFFLGLPIQGVECVDVPAVLVEAAHAVRSPVAEEPVQDCHLDIQSQKKGYQIRK